jgi:hypothetical protein
MSKPIDREHGRRRGLRAALAVATVAGIGIAAADSIRMTRDARAAAPASSNDGANGANEIEEPMRIHPQGGCCDWRFWGPPAPIAMEDDFVERLRRARLA